MKTKLILSALGVMALLATPAMAQKSYKRAPAAAAVIVGPGYYYSGGPASMFYEGAYIGTDPDPSVRSELQRDYPTALGAN